MWQKRPNFDFFEPRGPVFSSTGGEAQCLSQDSAPGLCGTRGDRCGSGKLDRAPSPQLGTRWPPGQAAGWQPRAGRLGKVFSAAVISPPIRCLQTSAQRAAARVQPGDIFAPAVNFQTSSSREGQVRSSPRCPRGCVQPRGGFRENPPSWSPSSSRGAAAGCVPPKLLPLIFHAPRGLFGAVFPEQITSFTCLPPAPPHGTRGTKLILEAIVQPEMELKRLSTFSVKKIKKDVFKEFNHSATRNGAGWEVRTTFIRQD